MSRQSAAPEADPAADFSVLGPLYVRAGASVVTVNSPRLRTLLAALLVNAGRVVTTRELAYAIWAHRQPESPRRALQVCIARLRSRLSGYFGDELITTVVDGYRIDVPPSQLDLARFTSRLEEADAAAAQGDVAGEAAALAAALAQWRGEPLADVPSEALRRQTIPRLHDAHLQALERYFDIRLRLGEHTDLVGHLFTLTAQHPGRERLWVQLLRALHAAGRRVEALDAYHTMRRRLATDFGLDPGQELRSLHAAILHGRDDLDEERPAAPTPRQLPPGVRGFTGRVDEIAVLDGLVAGLPETNVPVVAVVSGTAGVGKSSLAALWSRRVADQFPDGQLWLDLHGYDMNQPVAPEQALTRLLRALGVPGPEMPLDTIDQVGLWRSMMDGRRMLIVLDNASGADQVRPLLPGAPRCFVLVTSRHQLTSLVAVEGAHLLNLDLLSRDEAHQLLAQRLGADRVAIDAAAADEVVELSARLPLALAVVAARAATHPEFGMDVLASELRTAHHGLDGFARPDGAMEVRTALSWSYQALSPSAAHLFRLLSLHPGPDIGTVAAASLAAAPVPQVWTTLAEMCEAHLLTEHAPGRYSFHDLLRAYAGELAQSLDRATDRQAATRRVLDYYLHAAHRAASLLGPLHEPLVLTRPHPGVLAEPFDDREQAMAWFTAEHAVLHTVIDQAGRSGFPGHAGQLATAVSEYFGRRGFWQDWVATQQVALDAATLAGDEAGQARAHRGLARAYLKIRRADEAEAHCRRALELSEQCGDDRGKAQSHLGLGAILQQHRALEHCLRALDIFRAMGERAWEARALSFVGWTHRQLGQHDEGLAYCNKAIGLAQQIGDRLGEASTWDTLGYAHHGVGDHPQAVDCYQRAIHLFRELGDRFNEARGLSNLGDNHHAAGNIDAARRDWRSALDIMTEMCHPDAREITMKLCRLGRLSTA